MYVRWGSNRGSSLTLYFLLPSKGGSQRLTGGAKHPVSPAFSVPDAVAPVDEVLDPVSRQGQFSRVITVVGVDVPVVVIEGTLQHTTYPTTTSEASTDGSDRIREVTSFGVLMRGFLSTSAGE